MTVKASFSINVSGLSIPDTIQLDNSNLDWSVEGEYSPEEFVQALKSLGDTVRLALEMDQPKVAKVFQRPCHDCGHKVYDSKCEFCRARYQKSDHLRTCTRCLMVHQDPHACPYCGKEN